MSDLIPFTILPGWSLTLIMLTSLFVLGHSADLLVDVMVHLAARWHIPKVIVGATIVSIGTTFPEVTVSLLAAVQGNPGIALGNAVGSVICDTGLILGLASLLGPIPLNKQVTNRTAWLQLGAGCLLVLSAIPLAPTSWPELITHGGRIPRSMGFVFLLLLLGYIFYNIRSSRQSLSEEIPDSTPKEGVTLMLVKAVFLFVLIALSSEFLIDSAKEVGLRLEVPESIIAVTIVAFGTSLPELVTAVASVRKGHGEIALGNIVGADILNVLLVSGAAIAATPGGLPVDKTFFTQGFWAMIAILLICRIGLSASKERFSRVAGALLLASYLVLTMWNAIAIL